MAGQTNFLKLFFGSCKSLLTNRLVASTSFVQSAGLKKDTKEKLEKLHIPEKPKRPVTAYFRFIAEHRPLLQQNHPNWKITQLAKECSEKWKKLSDLEKEKYVNAYKAELAHFTPKLLHYNATLNDAQKEALAEAQKEKRNSRKKRSLRKVYRETNKPKRPKSSYLFFMEEKRLLPENKNKKPMDLAAMYKEEWNSITDEAKQKYLTKQDADRERYAKEMETWEIKMVQEGKEELLRKDSQFLVAAKPSHMESPKKIAHKSPRKESHKVVHKSSHKEISKSVDKASHKETLKKKKEH